MSFPSYSWPDWSIAPRGTRFRDIRSGREGTLIRPASCGHNGAIVEWDEYRFPVRSVTSEPNQVYFGSIAREAEPIDFPTCGPISAAEWVKHPTYKKTQKARRRR